MFYDNFLKACTLIGKKPTLVLTENGIGKSALTRWKNGGMPTDATLQKLGDYFGVSASDLKGEAHRSPITSRTIIKKIGRSTMSGEARDVAFAYDDAIPEIQAAVRRVLGMAECPPASDTPEEAM